MSRERGKPSEEHGVQRRSEGSRFALKFILENNERRVL